MLLNLSEPEIQRLHKLSQDKATVEALKKMFLNHHFKAGGTEVNRLAAGFISIANLEECFIALANIQPAESVNKFENMV